jgi:uncharacterized peroxidase-related enzyme
MSFIPLPDARGAEGKAREVLEATERRWGYAPNIVRALALRPELLEAEDVWSAALMRHGTLPRVLKEAVATTVSAVNQCTYCATSHAYAAEAAGGGRAVGDACMALRFDRFAPAERAALEFARKAARDMGSVTQADVDKLRAHYTPEQVVELAAVVASFMMYNTFVTVLGLELEPELRAKRSA